MLYVLDNTCTGATTSAYAWNDRVASAVRTTHVGFRAVAPTTAGFMAAASTRQKQNFIVTDSTRPPRGVPR